MKENNIYISVNAIKYNLQKFRELEFPNDSLFLLNLKNITINLDENISEFKNIPFCFQKENFLNPQKKFREESYILFTTLWQLKLIEKSKQIFIDATFKISPKGYYQLLNIFANIDDNNFEIPLIHVLMTNKSYLSYKKVFGAINDILKELNLDNNFENKYFMTDFEKSLRRVIKEKYPKAFLEGCYFHFIKALWEKSKRLGIYNKKNINNTKILIFAFKVYPFIKEKERDKYLEDIKDFIMKIETKKDKYLKFYLYFLKYWKNSNFLIFEGKGDKVIRKRTNNTAEGFHRYFNTKIEAYHPKISYFVSKLKEVTVEYYNKFLKNQIIELKQENKKYNIFNDIYEFVKDFIHKNNFSINFNDFSKTIQNNENSVSEIIIDIVGLLFGENNCIERNSKNALAIKNDDFIKIDANEDANESDINSQSDEKEEEIENLENKLNNIRLEDEEPMDIHFKIEHKRKADTEEIFDSLYNKKSKKYKK